MRTSKERGAVAVEFALLAPVLILMLFGIVEFGRAYNAQVSLTNAAREGVRVVAITQSQSAARTAAKNAAVTLNPALQDSNITFSPTAAGCAVGTQKTVTIKYTLNTITGFVGPFNMTGKAVMLCGG